MSEDEQFELEKCKYCDSLIPKGSYRCPVCGEKLKIDFKKALLIGGITFSVVLLLTITALYIKTPRKVDPPNEEVSTLDKGIDFFNKGDYFNAEDVLSKAIDENNDPKAFLYLGRIKERDNNIIGAIYNYKESLRLDPLNKQLIPHLVNLCIDENDKSCIDEFISEAYGESPTNSRIALNYAISENISQEDSFKVLKSIPSSDKNEYYYANKILGYYYIYCDEYKNAIPYLLRAYKLRDDHKKNEYAEDYLNQEYNNETNKHEGHALLACYILTEQYTSALKLLDDMFIKSGDPYLIEFKKEIIEARNEYNAEKNYQQEHQPHYSTFPMSSSRPASNDSPYVVINGVKMKPEIRTSGEGNGTY